MRIYPSVLLCVAIFHFGLDRSWSRWTMIDYISFFVWPTPFWFVAALMVFYIIFFSIMKLNNKWAFAVGILLLIFPYLYFYLTYADLSKYSIEGPGYFKWFFYLQIMFFAVSSPITRPIKSPVWCGQYFY